MLLDQQLFSPDDVKILIKGTASTLNALSVYLHMHGNNDAATAEMAERRMCELVGLCSQFTFSDDSNSSCDPVKNALFDIIQTCSQTPGHKDQLLLEYLETLCRDAEDKRNTPRYGAGALGFTIMVVRIVLSITTKNKEEVESMDEDSWMTYRHLLLMRLTLIEEWQELFSQLSVPCWDIVRSSSNDERGDVQILRKLVRAVDAGHLLD